MKKYTVVFTAQCYAEVVVEAEDEQDAEEVARNGEFDEELNWHDCGDVEVSKIYQN